MLGGAYEFEWSLRFFSYPRYKKRAPERGGLSPASDLYEIPISLRAIPPRKYMIHMARNRRPGVGTLMSTGAWRRACPRRVKPQGVKENRRAGCHHTRHCARLLRALDRLHHRLRSAVRRLA